MTNQTKSILYILDASISITGAFLCAKNEAKLLAPGVDVVLVVPANSKIKKKDLTEFKKVIQLPVINIRKSLYSIIMYIPVLIVSSWRLARLMNKDNCQILQVNDFYLMHGVFAKLFGYRGRLVTWVRIDPRRYGSFLSKVWLKLAYRYSNKVIAVSNFILNILPESDEIKLIYDPIMERDVDKSNHNIKSNVRKLIYIGNYIEGKGQQYAIEAFSQIAGSFNDVELHFYGGDMGLKKNMNYLIELKEQTKITGYNDRVYFHGFVDDVASVLKDGYLALNFSDSESFSLSCLEASYYGLPLVATASGGPQEIVNNGKTGFIVGIADVDSMVLSLEKLLHDKLLALTMGQRGADYVKEKFSIHKFLNNVTDVLKLKKY